jgi:hypothetical protein
VLSGNTGDGRDFPVPGDFNTRDVMSGPAVPVFPEGLPDIGIYLFACQIMQPGSILDAETRKTGVTR